MTGLQGLRILIVEDEYLLAAELAEHFENAGAEVLGPVPSVEAGRQHVEAAQAAVLDVKLDDGNVFPLADLLSDREVPIVFFSGYDADVLPERFRYVSRLAKPANVGAVLEALSGGAADRNAPKTREIVSLMPKLRLAARLLVRDSDAADRLVERTLERAIAELRAQADPGDRADWLNEIMHDVLKNELSDILN